jgi:hypothetical protein
MKPEHIAAALILILSIGFLGAPHMYAQQADAAPQKLVLAKGTEVHLRMAQDISSRAARPGEPIELKLAEDLKVGDVVVAKSGARALGEVAQGKKPDFWGDPGEVSIRLRFLRVGDKKVEIEGSLAASGVIYVIVRGSQGIIKAGTPVKAYVASDVEVTAVSEQTPSGK